jgi:hypothetical protein
MKNKNKISQMIKKANILWKKENKIKKDLPQNLFNRYRPRVLLVKMTLWFLLLKLGILIKVTLHFWSKMKTLLI